MNLIKWINRKEEIVNNMVMSESKKYLALSRKEGDQIITNLKEKYGDAVKEYSLKKDEKLLDGIFLLITL